MPGLDGDAEIYLTKAAESLLTAESEMTFGRYNSCANRCYYPCFQATIAALLQEGIRPTGRWTHESVQAQFAGQLVNHRKRFGTGFRRTLPDSHALRIRADYGTGLVKRAEARQTLERSRRFVEAIRAHRGFLP